MPSLRERIKGLFGISFGGQSANNYISSQAWVRGEAVSSGSVLEDPYANSATIAVAVATVADDAASVRWELYKDGAEDEVEEHPLFDLWERPNARMYGIQLWVGTYVCRKLFGEAFWYYPELTIGEGGGLRAMRRSTGEIALLDPRNVVHKVKGGELSWAWRANGQEFPLDPERLTHFKRYNPYDPIRGLSELQSVLIEAEGDTAAASWNRGFFSSQNGVPSGLLHPSADAQPMDAEERRDFLRQWNQTHATIKRSTGALPRGWTWQDLGVSQREMDFRALREYSREQILAVFGVPPFMAGVLDKANYANAREQKSVYWHGTITRFLSEIQGVLNGDFLPKVGMAGYSVFPCWEQVKALTENLIEKVDVGTKLFAMGFTKRQINDRLKLGFDVDDLEDPDTGYLPFSMAPVALLSMPRTVAGPVDEGEEDDEKPEEETEDEKGLTRKALPSSEMEETRRALVWRNLILRTRDIENRFGSVVRRHMNGLRQEALDYANGLKGWLDSRDAIRKQDGTDTVSLTIIDLEKAKRNLRAATDPVHRQALKRGGESLIADAGLGIAFDLADPVAMGKLAELSHKITRIDDTIEAALRASLGQGIDLGESPGQLAARVNQVMDVSIARSNAIARTETGFAFNTGRHVAMQQNDIERQEWLTARDGRVRDTHMALDGMVASMGEDFIDKNGRVTGLKYPLDPSGPAGEVVNCRCVALPVLEA